MRISLSDIGKRFNREWIFRHCTYTFEPGGTYAITGPNGSGKSTLLQIVAGALVPSEGVLEWAAPDADTPIDPNAVYAHMALAAPYLEVIEEMTLTEFLTFHQDFKPWVPGMDVGRIIDAIGLGASRYKQIRDFSSGMKQRVRLAQALFSHTPVLLLDEPCTNFDQAGYELYGRLIAEHGRNRTVIVSSNDPAEYVFCRDILPVGDFKKS